MEITKKDIEQLIELKREDTFFNHLKTIYSFDFRPTGEIGRNEIKLWRQNSWNRTFYPIFRFELNANNHLINITDKLNPIGKTFILIFLLGFLYLIFPENPFEFDVIDSHTIQLRCNRILTHRSERPVSPDQIPKFRNLLIYRPD